MGTFVHILSLQKVRTYKNNDKYEMIDEKKGYFAFHHMVLDSEISALGAILVHKEGGTSEFSIKIGGVPLDLMENFSRVEDNFTNREIITF